MKKNFNKLPPFVALTMDMLNSTAYKDLTFAAGKLLPYFLCKVKKGFNDPERYSTVFTFSFPEAKRYGFATATFFRAYNELAEKGFIEIAEKGGLRGTGKSCNKYLLSKAWNNYMTKKEIEAENEKLKLIWDSLRRVP